MKDIPRAIFALVVVGALLLTARSCFAGEWFPEASLYLDVMPENARTFCQGDGHASHLGARVDIWTEGRHTFRTLWVHNSCVEDGEDRRSRDVIGFGYEFRLW